MRRSRAPVAPPLPTVTPAPAVDQAGFGDQNQRLPAALRLQTGDARLRALVGDVAGAARADAPVWLDIDAVEQLFNLLVARAQGRPASQDSLPVDGPSAARLVIVRELLHHWRLDGLRLTA